MIILTLCVLLVPNI